MTTDLEKQFFDTFGIEPKNRFKGCKLGIKYYSEICNKPTCNGCDDEIRETEYPQITDRISLELICIHNQYLHPFSIFDGGKKEFLKNDILECMVNILNYFYKHEMGEYYELKHQVRTLFEEGLE